VQTTSGLPLHVPCAARELRGPVDTLVIPGGLGTAEFARRLGVVDWLRETAAVSRRVASVCTGSMLLAQAGLLDGRRITTHWAACAQLAEMRPSVIVDPEPIFTRSDKYYTSAGVTAGMDLALALIEEDWGSELALAVARWLVMFLKRPGSQPQRSMQLSAQTEQKHGLSELRAWIIENLAAELNIDSVARRAGMSRRNLCRAFHRHTGMTPSKFVEAARVDAAQRWLAQSDHSLDDVAQRCGFGSAETLRRTFRRCLGVTPSDYRQRERRMSSRERELVIES
jgi:transcriptional regulator GlxA family with amidase domain